MLKTFIFKKTIEIDEQPVGVQVAEAIIKAEADWITRELPAGMTNGSGNGGGALTGGTISTLKKASDQYPKPANINALLLSVPCVAFSFIFFFKSVFIWFLLCSWT